MILVCFSRDGLQAVDSYFPVKISIFNTHDNFQGIFKLWEVLCTISCKAGEFEIGV